MTTTRTQRYHLAAVITMLVVILSFEALALYMYIVSVTSIQKEKCTVVNVTIVNSTCVRTLYDGQSILVPCDSQTVVVDYKSIQRTISVGPGTTYSLGQSMDCWTVHSRVYWLLAPYHRYPIVFQDPTGSVGYWVVLVLVSILLVVFLVVFIRSGDLKVCKTCCEDTVSTSTSPV